MTTYTIKSYTENTCQTSNLNGTGAPVGGGLYPRI